MLPRFSIIRLTVCIVMITLIFFLQCRDHQTRGEKVEAYQVSVASELKNLYDLSRLPIYGDYESHQVSTYDTTGGNDDGFSGKYSYIRKNPDGSLVIFDVTGSGVINRIWTPTPTSDTLDFYIDDPVNVTFSICYKDLFSGEQYPFIEPLCGNQIGGYFCYFPIPFEKSCKIVCRGRELQFHQIQYKLLSGSVAVESFSPILRSDEKESLDKLINKWEGSIIEMPGEPTDADDVKTIEQSGVLNPGETLTLFKLRKGGRILGIEMIPTRSFTGLQKQLDLKVTWDREEKPAIYCPVPDFFGYAFGEASMQSLILGTSGNKHYCYFPMPFDGYAKVELIYRRDPGDAHQTPIQLQSKIFYTLQPRDPEVEGKLYARWNRSRPEKGMMYTFLNRSGRGHYVGTILQAQGLRPGMTTFFEGDDSTAVDGQMRMHGTGSEDYFNGGWYAFMDRWDTKISLPLHGSLDYSLPLCRTGGYRLFLADKISFQKSIYHGIEHGPQDNSFPVDYTSMAFYYCDSPVQHELLIPYGDNTRVFVPDTMIMYPQLMKFTLWNNINFQFKWWYYDIGGASVVLTADSESRIRISLSEIPHQDYRLFMDLTSFNEGCKFSVWQRQTRISDWIETCNTNEERMKDLYVCDISIGDFKDAITIRFETDEQHKKLFLNRIILVKKG